MFDNLYSYHILEESECQEKWYFLFSSIYKNEEIPEETKVIGILYYTYQRCEKEYFEREEQN